MKRDSLLIAGLGQCGNLLADLMRSVNQRYTPIYINSSLGDTKDLKWAKKDTNVFIYGGADGSGRDRRKAEQLIQLDKLRLASFIKKYAQFSYMLIFTSMAGGTGSGSVSEFVKIVKQVFPKMIINVVGVLPSLKEENLQLRNALDCYNDLSEISDLINDIKFINNNKGKNYSEINKESVLLIDKSYGMLGHSRVGSVDEDNLTKVTTAKGYGIILELPKHYSSLEDAITETQERSVFSMPSSLECVYGAINVTDKYDIDNIVELVEADETIYKTYGDKMNVIALGGCNFPDGDIDDIEATLKERELRKSSPKKRGFGFKPKYGTTDKEESVVDENEEISKDYIDDDDLDKIFNPDNIRF